MEEAKNEYKIDFGPYSVELKGSQVYFRKNNSLVKAMPVKSTFGLYDLKKMVQQVAKKVNMLNKLPKDVLKAGKDRDLLKGDLDEDFVRSGHMYKSLTYKVTDSKAVMAAYKKFKAGNRTINMVVKASGDTITISGHPTKGLWISPSIADSLDVAIQKTGKATLVKSDSKKLKENAEQIFRKAIREIATPMLKGMMNEISAGQGLKDVINGRTSSIEGIKMSKNLAQGIMAWIGGSSYGRKYAKQILKGRLGSLLKPANAWGIQRYLDTKGNKEWKAIMSKVKEAKGKGGDVVQAVDMTEASRKSDRELLKIAAKGAKQARIGSTAEREYLKSLQNSWRINRDQKDYYDCDADCFEEDARNWLDDKR